MGNPGGRQTRLVSHPSLLAVRSASNQSAQATLPIHAAAPVHSNQGFRLNGNALRRKRPGKSHPSVQLRKRVSGRCVLAAAQSSGN